MSKKSIIILLTAIIVGIVLIIGLIRLTNDDQLKYISRKLDTEVDNCKLDNYYDTHGGFLGDGDYFAKLVCSSKEDIIIKDKWVALPLSSELQSALDMKWCGNNECKNVFEKYHIPSIINGYYYFLDRHREAKDNSGEELNSRSSYNFSIGIYDSDNKILYFYELDT